MTVNFSKSFYKVQRKRLETWKSKIFLAKTLKINLTVKADVYLKCNSGIYTPKF